MFIVGFIVGRRNAVRALLPSLLIGTLLFPPVQSFRSIPMLSGAVAQAAVLPELPRVYLDTTYTLPSGRTIAVPAGGDFQAALNTAQPGDVITLQAGATFQGPFTLPNKSGTGWIYVRTSAPDSSLPPPGTRVTLAHALVMPKIVVGSGAGPAIRTAASAHHFRFIGIEVAPLPGAFVYNLIELGSGNETATAALPYHIIFDRSYIHGDPVVGGRRGIAMNSASTAVIDSYLMDFKEVGADSQAIAGWNGPGPFKIVNNFLAGAGENVIFGGADPKIQYLVPSDIEIRGNHFFKPLAWRVGDPSYAGTHWSVKNLFELKNARRVLVDGNILEYNWADAQVGFAVLFTVRNQNGTAPWSVVEDITFTRNIVQHVGQGIHFLGWDNLHPSEQTKRILVRDNLFVDVGGIWGGGRLFMLIDGTADVTIDHTTAFQTDSVIAAGGRAHTGFAFTNNIAPHNRYGVGGDNTYGDPMKTLNTYFPGYVFARNVLPGGNATQYPPDNFFPPTLADVGFVDLAGGNYRLAASSPYKHAGTDGKDIGADIDAINAATAGSVTGSPAPQVAAQTTPLAPAKTATIVGGSAGGAAAGATVTSSATADAAQTPTSPVVTADIAPLLISSVTVAFATASEAAVTWATNKASDSQVEYGPTTGYGGVTTVDTRKVTAHAVTLSGLTAGTTYHFRVKSRDAAGNLTTSSDFTLTTALAEP